jgi:hypothetical protein
MEFEELRKKLGGGLRTTADYVDAGERFLRLNPFIDAGARAKESLDAGLQGIYDAEWTSAAKIPGTKKSRRWTKTVAYKSPLFWVLLGASKLKPASILRDAGDFIYGEDE